MKKRYHCPKHKEVTPSAVAYHDGYHCFGCGARGPLTDLGMEPGEKPEITYVEDLKASLAAISRLPRGTVRGLNLPITHNGYYLVWPNGDYYKFRRADATTPGGKYRGPSGHPKPPLVVPGNEEAQTLVLVEGEFNALTLAKLELPVRIISPGAAGDFYAKGREKDLTAYSTYETVYIVVDDDAAGAQAAIEAKSRILIANRGCDVRIKLLKEDLNDVYVQRGQEALKDLARSLGLPGAV